MSLSEDFYGLPESEPAIYLKRDLEAVARRWDGKAARWDIELENPNCHLNADGAYDKFLSLARKLVSERFNLCASGLLVDLGCGTGLVLSDLAPFFRRAVGIDISRQMLSVASAKAIPNAEWRLGDVFDHDWHLLKPAAIVSRGVLISHYGCELTQALLKTLAHSFNAGGFALFDFLSAEAPSSQRAIAPNKTHFSPDWMADQARRSGVQHFAIEGSTDDRVRFLVLR